MLVVQTPLTRTTRNSAAAPFPPHTHTLTATECAVAWSTEYEVVLFLNLKPTTFMTLLDKVSPSWDGFQRGKKDQTNKNPVTVQ